MIAIRKFTETDIPLLYHAVRASAKEVSPWLPWCHAHYSLEESQAFISAQEEAWRQDEQYNFVITSTETKDFLGSVGINLVNRRILMANLGYWVRSDITRGGIATAATLLAARFAIKELGLERIEIVAAVENKASCRVAEKAGAQKEGILRKRVWVNGQLTDGVMYSLIREDLFR
jgi:RimJ/RimL family protein N-acetyltransferase